MARANAVVRRRRISNVPVTHEGAPAVADLTPEQQLRRSVLACLLWEDTFYESGVEIAQRIAGLAQQCSPAVVAALAEEARQRQHLRHAPLLLLAGLCRSGSGSSMVSEAIARTIGRVDEIPELLAIYWRANERDGARGTAVQPKRISAQLKKGLAKAFQKFDRYQVSKYRGEGRGVTLLDALRLCAAIPADSEHGQLLRELKAGTLRAPETWERRLSGGADKRETFAALLAEGKLGYMALLRNLRNMAESGVDEQLVRDAIVARKGARHVLPFRFITAARHAPTFERELDVALKATIGDMAPLEGRTLVLVDVSGSMIQPLSGKSELTRMDAAAALAAIVPGDVQVFSFSDRCVKVRKARGLAGVRKIILSQAHGGTRLGDAVLAVQQLPHDRMIAITDEQAHPMTALGYGHMGLPEPVCERAYCINVASYANGVGYGRWIHIDGFSEATLTYIREIEGKPGEPMQVQLAEDGDEEVRA